MILGPKGRRKVCRTAIRRVRLVRWSICIVLLMLLALAGVDSAMIEGESMVALLSSCSVWGGLWSSMAGGLSLEALGLDVGEAMKQSTAMYQQRCVVDWRGRGRA